MVKIANVKGRQIFDSRGNPTVEAEVILDNGILATSTLVAKDPFSERYFKSLNDFIINNEITITSLNNVPYIFVYALFAGKSKFEKGQMVECFFPNHSNQTLI